MAGWAEYNLGGSLSCTRDEDDLEGCNVAHLSWPGSLCAECLYTESQELGSMSH